MADISVLLIEDNKDDEWLALRSFKKIGLNNLTVARDGLTALTILLGNKKKTGEGVSRSPDLIFLDLRLPKIDGIDVLRKIHADGLMDCIKVFVLSSSEDPYDMNVCKQLGVHGFFSKPLDKEAILLISELCKKIKSGFKRARGVEGSETSSSCEV